MDKYNINEYSIKICQKYIRSKLARLLCYDKKAQDVSLKSNVVNNTTLVGDDIKDIPDIFFYTLLENDQLYGFDIRELWEWVIINNRTTNPFTNNKLLSDQLKQINRLYHKSNNGILSKINSNLESYSAKLASFFIRLESYGCYANLEGYKTLTIPELTEFVNILYNNNDLIRKCIDEKQINIPDTNDPNYKSLLLDLFNLILDENPIDQTTIALLFVDRLAYYIFNNKNDTISSLTSLENLDNFIDQIIQFNTYSITSNSEISNIQEDSFDSSMETSSET